MTIGNVKYNEKSVECHDGPKLYKWGTLQNDVTVYGTSPPDDEKPLHYYLANLQKETPKLREPLSDKGVVQLKPNDPQAPLSLLPKQDVREKIELVGHGFKLERHTLSFEDITKNAEEFFQDIALKDEHLLKLFMEKFPKTDLHMHIDGSIHSRQLLNIAVVKNLYCRVRDDYFEFGTKEELTPTIGTLQGNTIISAKQLQQDTTLRNMFYEVVSMRGAKGGTQSGHHKHFFQAFNTLESIAKHIHLKEKLELLLRNTNDHVRYLEPSIWFEKEDVPESFKVKFNSLIKSGGLEKTLNVDTAKELISDTDFQAWLKRYVNDVIKTLNDCKAVTDEKLIEKGFNQGDLFDISNLHVVRFIIDNDRTTSCLATVFAHFVGSMTLECLDERVVGSGFAGEEHDDNAVNDYDEHMHIIKTLKECFPESKLSLHAGELNRQLSQIDEPLQTNVRKALLAGADRIGHGVCITDDPKWPELFTDIKEKDVHIECCLKSNENVLGITNGTHPISWFISKGVSFSLCTDDQGVNNSSPAAEMLLAAQRYNTNNEHVVEKGRNLGYKQLKHSVLNSVRKSFLPGESIYRSPDETGEPVLKEPFAEGDAIFSGLRSAIRGCIDPESKKWTLDVFNILSTEQREFIKNSQKAQMELEIEKEFVYFEQIVIPSLKMYL